MRHWSISSSLGRLGRHKSLLNAIARQPNSLVSNSKQGIIRNHLEPTVLGRHLNMSTQRSSAAATHKAGIFGTKNNAWDEFELPEMVSEILKVPMFSVSSESIATVRTPRQFYGLLKNKIMQAKRRIFISTLYIGREERELAIYLGQALARQPQLQLTILMDAMRATRESPSSVSSASLLSHLAAMFPNQVDIRLYATPALRPKSLKARLIGKRFNEGLGLQHMKVYGFDDDAIISGANLSRDYFIRRMDRYMLIRNNESIANYLHSLILLISRFSYELQYKGDEQLINLCREHIFDMDDFSKEHMALSQSPFHLGWDGGDGLLLSEDTDGTISAAGLWPSSETFPEKNWKDMASKSLRDFTIRWHERVKAQRSHRNGDTRLIPLLQMGQLSITQETDMIPLLTNYLSALCSRINPMQTSLARPFTTVDLTSGYFTLSGTYRSLVLSDKIHSLGTAPSSVPVVFRLVAASPEANGFYGSKGLSSRIPAAYTFLEKEFYKQVVAKSLHEPFKPDGGSSIFDSTDPVSQGSLAPVELREWSKYGWTYHQKGIWISLPSQNNQALQPSTTLIGSSNFGSRSEKLDLECTLLMTTKATPLKAVLAEEVLEMRECARELMNSKTFDSPERKVDIVTRFLTKLVKYML